MNPTGLWLFWVWGWGTNGGTGSWSSQSFFSPSTVAADGELNEFFTVDSGYGSAGFLNYTTRDPNTGVDSLVDLSQTQVGLFIMPGPTIFDNNVDSITFATQYGDLNNTTQMCATYRVWFF